MRERFLLVPFLLGVFFVTLPLIEVATDADPFLTGDRCVGCHKGVATSSGVDVSIGFDWRASMMANSGRDPYWQAAVRREVMDHPEAAEAIEDKCSRCHMPMVNELDRRADGAARVFANARGGEATERMQKLANNGVSCSLCHQIEPVGLGTEASYVGGFEIARDTPSEDRPVFGPFQPDDGGAGIMHSATGYRPREGDHIQSSELCASCHTLFTHAIRGDGTEGPEFPEQVPYQEWAASRYAEEGQSCQDCHMPVVEEAVAVTGVLGQPREDVSRHVFRGGNFFMLRLLNRYGGELGVGALPQELELAAQRTSAHLRTATAHLSLENGVVETNRLTFDVVVSNHAGHKFPTAYPSRRAWLRVAVRDGGGRLIFESGAFQPDGSIAGNDNDQDPTRYEPHYREITDPSEVQIYEAIMVDGDGDVTTGLMQAERWIKDNRLLPDGFDPAGRESRIGVRGEARDDASFQAGVDRVPYLVSLEGGSGPYTVIAELWFQPVAYRWAENLAAYGAFETDRFVRYYRSMASTSGIPLARSEQTLR